jgi:membrane-associated phospholipid phosphatase
MLVRAGARIGWVDIPAVYEGAPSSFRALPDGARVARAIVSRPRQSDPGSPGTGGHEAGAHSSAGDFAREWGRRLGIALAATLALGAMLPLVEPLDARLFLAVNSLGDGPDWLYQALDPHTRNYVLITALAVAAAALSGRRALGAAVAVVGAAFASDLVLQSIHLVVERPRPEEVLGSQAALVDGRSWAALASFPSGHLMVTTAMAVAAMSAVPALRRPLWIYVGAIALTRVLFGAHFPLDVAVGFFFGYEMGRFSAALCAELGLLPAEARGAAVDDGARSASLPACDRPAFERAAG